LILIDVARFLLKKNKLLCNLYQDFVLLTTVIAKKFLLDEQNAKKFNKD